GDRRDTSVARKLREMLRMLEGQPNLEALWALNLIGAFDDDVAMTALKHADPYVRLWSVRLLGDANEVSPSIATKLTTMAATEPHVEVRSQLAASAARLPVEQGLPIILALCGHDEDVNDPFIPKQ